MGKKSAYVFIQIEGKWIPCGYLSIFEENRTIYSEFEYGHRYLERDDCISIDPVQLPLEKGIFRTRADEQLFGGIRDASPDSWGRHLLERAAEPQAPGEFEYLTAIPTMDRVGAISFGSTVKEPEPINPGWKNYPPIGSELNLEDMLQAADQCIDYEEISPELRRFLVRGSSLGGAQPKAPTTYDGKPWIVKFSREYEAWSTCRIENANMKLAKLCGINTPETRIIKVKERDVYLISRFDRDPFGNHIHFISAATLLGTEKIDNGTYHDIANQMKKYCSSQYLKEDIKQLFKRMVFNILCNNTDDHLRNHGFLYIPNQGFTLSPAYDIVPQPDMGDGLDRKLILGVKENGDRKPSLENALSSSGSFGIADDEANKIVNEMKHIFITEWESVYKDCGVSNNDISILKSVFTNHLN